MTPFFMIPPICSGEGGDLPCNHLASALEVAEFCDDPPARAFVYVKGDPARPGGLLVTTWMGDLLGRAFPVSRAFRSNMGDIRQTIMVQGVNGCAYRGTYYASAGDYARIRRVK